MRITANVSFFPYPALYSAAFIFPYERDNKAFLGSTGRLLMLKVLFPCAI